MKILIDFIKSRQEVKFEDIFIPICSYAVFYFFYYNFISTDILNRRVSAYSFNFFAVILIFVRFVRFKKTYNK